MTTHTKLFDCMPSYATISTCVPNWYTLPFGWNSAAELVLLSNAMAMRLLLLTTRTDLSSVMSTLREEEILMG